MTTYELDGYWSWADLSKDKVSASVTMNEVNADGEKTPIGSAIPSGVTISGTSSNTANSLVSKQTGGAGDSAYEWSVSAYLSSSAAAEAGGGAGSKSITLVPSLKIGGVVQSVTNRVSAPSR